MMFPVISIAHVADMVGRTVLLKGWVRHRRSSGKLQFLTIRDGSGDIQAILNKGTLGEEYFDRASRLTQESLLVTGVPRADARATGGYEDLIWNLGSEDWADWVRCKKIHLLPSP